MCRLSTCVAFVLCVSVGHIANARTYDDVIGPFEGSSDSADDFEEGAPWREGVAELPDPPKDENLVEVDIDRIGGGFKVFLDRPSLSIGEDDIVRYTVVLRTRGGANNVFFEGIRCDTQQYKRYAFGNLKGGFQKPRETRWQGISSARRGDYHYELYSDYFCEASVPRSMKRIDRILKGYDAGRGEPEDDFFF